ncbi:MAG TPA: lactate utilization protein C [Nocardioides sp.]|uniref:LutC/YkgG family protein n=1 Tax=Nocardioides sp. TaxID=35761 RepID=UPI002CAAC334|nr:lactate utilization protein C [Nocardioides sp.]HQR25469.1 lactate utilization protein C [Nocardioides sp.]
MSAREDVLAAVRRALAPRSLTAPPVGREYRRPGADDDPVALFAERVADYRATVVRCAPKEVQTAIGDALAGRSVVVPAGLPWPVDGAVVDSGQSPAELDRIDAVVTGATLGIAVTGTVVLDHGPGQGRRALSLVPDLHVCVVRADQVVPGVPEAVARLDPSRPQTWISGPSATSDIELTRVEGVHGPRTLVVLLVAGPDPSH